MSRTRELTITALIICMAGVMLYSTFAVRELYPFAPYTMYATRYNPATFSDIRVFFITHEGTETPVENELIFPMDEARLSMGLMAVSVKKEDENDLEPAGNQKLADVFEMYKRNCSESDSQLPVFIGLRAYHFNWGSHEALLDGVPAQKKVIAEYLQQ